MTTRSGIPLDTLPTATTLREAAEKLIDHVDDWARDDDMSQYEFVLIPTRVVGQLRDALAADATNRALIRKAADYIAADRAWRNRWSEPVTSENEAEAYRLLSVAQDARIRLSDEDIAALKRIGGA